MKPCGCCGLGDGSPSPTYGRRASTPHACANSAGATCGVATSAGGCGTADPGSRRAWSPRPSRCDTRRACLGAMNRTEVTEQVVLARLREGLTWQQLADAIGRPLMWTTAALLGQHPIPVEQAKVL